ncbi:MAG TPA: hypothetical protein PK156_05360 [Polyangium sp.]|nr:hypothetical protein [Polyangium sp.]
MSTASLSLQTSLLFIFSTLMIGCGNEAIIFVDPTVSSPQVNVISGILGSTVTGSFQLQLVLGPRASGPSTVNFGAVNITDAGGKTALVSSLSMMPSEPFPINVAPDSEIMVNVPFDLGNKTIPMATMQALCSAGQVTISGTITDSLVDTATPFVSEAVKPMGCP